MKKFKVTSEGDFMNRKSEISRNRIITEISANSSDQIETEWQTINKTIKRDLAFQKKFIFGDLSFVKAKEI